MKPKYYWIKYTPEDEEPIITIGALYPANKFGAGWWQVIGEGDLIGINDPRVGKWYGEIERPDWLDEEERALY